MKLRVSVIDLIQKVGRTGDLYADAGVFSARLVEGTRLHSLRRLQRDAGFQSEVTLRSRVRRDGVDLTVYGRVDGLLEEEGRMPVIEEFKTGRVPDSLDSAPAEYRMQATLYAAMYALDRGAAEVELILSFLDPNTGESAEFRWLQDAAEAIALFDELTGRLIAKFARRQAHIERRDETLIALEFPYKSLREGQLDLIEAARESFLEGGILFAQAPTGIGKTLAVLYAGLKALPGSGQPRLFYLTGKTTGRISAQTACGQLRGAGAHLRSITMTAKDKICPFQDAECGPETCPYARGHYDRIRDAIDAALESFSIERANIEAVAKAHRVCPFELALDVSEQCDVIICDFNHAFDPASSIKRYFSQKGAGLLAIDEAHNLLERARDMFSCVLSSRRIADTARKYREFEKLYSSARALLIFLSEAYRQMQEESREAQLLETMPTQALELLAPLVEAIERVLPSLGDSELLDFYFEMRAAADVLERFEPHGYSAFYLIDGRQIELHALCADPAARLYETLERCHAAVFFSATLSPLSYYRELLCGREEAGMLELASPFPRENVCVLIDEAIDLRYRSRDANAGELCALVAAAIARRPGNYLAFFPSYQYLNKVLPPLRAALPSWRIIVQQSGMDDRARAAFLKQFEEDNPQGLLGLAVMGGAFSESIDLKGEKLLGAVLAGVGLPQVCARCEAIRAHFERNERPGYAYAYVYPGIERVLQAAGRVIRDEQDRGVIALLDSRFASHEYYELLPQHFLPAERLRGADQIAAFVQSFWES